LRIETVINKPKGVGALSRLEHLPELIEKSRQVNDRLLMIERAGQGCAIGSALFERIHQPYAREANGPGHFASGINAPRPWPVHSASWFTLSPASATRAFAGMLPDSSARTTANAAADHVLASRRPRTRHMVTADAPWRAPYHRLCIAHRSETGTGRFRRFGHYLHLVDAHASRSGTARPE
jgi:hypothetical protein